MNFRIAFAEHCAWRATYAYVNDKLVARIGVDPTASCPSIFGAFPIGIRTACSGERYPRLVEFRIPIPFMAWKHDGWYIRNVWRNWVRSLDGRYTKAAHTARANCR